MPDISELVKKEIETRLAGYLSKRAGYKSPIYIASGGSAATYLISSPDGPRAIKVYDPKFLEGSAAKAEKRRLDLQRKLIGHTCKQLVTIYSVVEEEATAFVEMEYVEWPQLKKVIPHVPDECVSLLIKELVTATVFLEALQIVHRDIKPENIHVSPDFKQLKLLDLGVARGIDLNEDDSGEGTDQGHARPFISTAQYSSPEYLFRLDEPSPTLWKGLNIYQVGAVLHDLINKRPIFQDEVDKDNRWLIARAVLEKNPSFPDSDPSRLIKQKALASRCLTKDGVIRLQIASWADFNFEAPADGLAVLQAQLAKEKTSTGVQSLTSLKSRINFERASFIQRFCEEINSKLIPICYRQINIRMYPDDLQSPDFYTYDFSLRENISVRCTLHFSWGAGFHSKTATVEITGAIIVNNTLRAPTAKLPLVVATIGESEEINYLDVANNIACLLSFAVDLIEGSGSTEMLDGFDLASSYKING